MITSVTFQGVRLDTGLVDSFLSGAMLSAAFVPGNRQIPTITLPFFYSALWVTVTHRCGGGGNLPTCAMATVWQRCAVPSPTCTGSAPFTQSPITNGVSSFAAVISSNSANQRYCLQNQNDGWYCWIVSRAAQNVTATSLLGYAQDGTLVPAASFVTPASPVTSVSPSLTTFLTGAGTNPGTAFDIAVQFKVASIRQQFTFTSGSLTFGPFGSLVGLGTGTYSPYYQLTVPSPYNSPVPILFQCLHTIDGQTQRYRAQRRDEMECCALAAHALGRSLLCFLQGIATSRSLARCRTSRASSSCFSQAGTCLP